MHLHMVEQDTLIKALLQLVYHQHIFAGAPAAIKAEVNGTFILGLFQPIHFFQPLFPALRRTDGFLPVKPAIPGDDGLLTGNFLLLHFIGLHANFEPLGTLRHIGRVVAVVAFRGAQQQLTHAVAHVIHEVPVMANQQHRAPIGAEIILQPGNGLQVQMVGRLVQQQQIRLRQQHPCQTKPGTLTAGKQLGRLTLLLLAEA